MDHHQFIDTDLQDVKTIWSQRVLPLTLLVDAAAVCCENLRARQWYGADGSGCRICFSTRKRRWHAIELVLGISASRGSIAPTSP